MRSIAAMTTSQPVGSSLSTTTTISTRSSAIWARIMSWGATLRRVFGGWENHPRRYRKRHLRSQTLQDRSEVSESLVLQVSECHVGFDARRASRRNDTCDEPAHHHR